jgi:hypothetical protein
MTPAEARGVILRLLLWLPPLIWLAWSQGWNFAHALLPMFRTILDAVMTDFSLLSLEIGYQREYVFMAQLISEQIQVVGGRIMPAGITVDASTPMYGALVHPIILAAAALAWPGLHWRARVARLLLSLPFLLLLEMVDIPLVLASAITDLLSFSTNPEADRASALVDWIRLMDGGGRLALAIAGAFMAAVLHDAIARRRAAGMSR